MNYTIRPGGSLNSRDMYILKVLISFNQANIVYSQSEADVRSSPKESPCQNEEKNTSLSFLSSSDISSACSDDFDDEEEEESEDDDDWDTIDDDTTDLDFPDEFKVIKFKFLIH